MPNGKHQNNQSTMSVLSEISFGELSDSELMNKEFEILSAGKKVYRGRVLNISENDLAEMEKYFNENLVGTQLAVDVNHDRDHRAVAWFNTVRKVGNKLMATFKDFTEEGKKLILEKQYKYFSVEFENGFQKLVNGAMKTFNNVLRGVALTNRPVDKDLAPTFMSEALTQIFSNQRAMNPQLKSLSEFLLAKDKLSKDEKELWNQSVSALSDEEAASEEVKTASAEVEAKPEADPAEDDAAAEAAKKAAEEKAAAEAAAAKAEEEKKALAEENKTTNQKLSEMQSELSKLKEENRKKELSERCTAEVQLSEQRGTGLSKEDTAEFSEFLATLSAEKAEKAISFMQKVKTVDFNEYGSAQNGDVKEDKTDEIATLAEKAMEKDPSLNYARAVSKVLSENPELAEKADQVVEMKPDQL